MKIKYAAVFLMVFIVCGNVINAKGSPAPSYYTYDDLVQVARNNQGQFYYDNWSSNKNSDIAFIPTGPSTGESAASISALWVKNNSSIKAQYAGKFKKINHKKGASKQNFTSKGLRIQSFPYTDIDWMNMIAFEGDLLFLRCNSSAGRLIHYFTGGWTHVAMIVDVNQHRVLDSMSNGGVAYRSTDNGEYTKLVSYGTKSVGEGYDNTKALQAISEAGQRPFNGGFLGISYWPTAVNKASYSSTEFYKKWSSKNDMDSMYCSKLVWKTFYDFYVIKGMVDLDSNRTKCFVGSLKNSDGSWIGVSPDDIWGSSYTSEWWDLVQADQLSYSIPL